MHVRYDFDGLSGCLGSIRTSKACCVVDFYLAVIKQHFISVFVDAAVNDGQSEDSLKTLTTPTNLKQNFVIVPAKLRLVILASFVLWKCRFGPAKKLLIFFATQDMVDFHSELFDRCLNRKDEVGLLVAMDPSLSCLHKRPALVNKFFA